MKPRAAYEQLVGTLFGAAIAADVDGEIEVTRNHILTGKTTSHEIDVFLRLRLGPVPYETVIQAKDWRKPLDQGEVLKLKGVLDDLPNQPRGIIVCRNGFQAGAVKVAAGNGILLFNLDAASRENRLTITTNDVVQFEVTKEPIVFANQSGNVTTGERRFSRHTSATVYSPRDICATFHTRMAGAEVGALPATDLSRVALEGDGYAYTLSTLLQECVKYAADANLREWMGTRLLPRPLELFIAGQPLASSPVSAVTFAFAVDVTSYSFPWSAAEFVDFVLRNVVSGETMRLRLS